MIRGGAKRLSTPALKELLKDASSSLVHLSAEAHAAKSSSAPPENSLHLSED